MRDIFDALVCWRREGRPFASATVVQIGGSAPREAGSVMLVREDGRSVGAVSGGCVEAAVLEAAQETLRNGASRLLDFPEAGDPLLAAGLPCGGRIRVFVERHPALSPRPEEAQVWQALEDRLRNDLPALLVRDLEPAGLAPLLVAPDGLLAGDWGGRTEPAQARALEAYGRRSSGAAEVEGRPVFIHALLPRDRLLVVGAGPIAQHLAVLARETGFRCVVIEPRQALAAPERFATPPDRLLTEWPDTALRDLHLDEACYAVVLTHDAKIDDVALEILLKSPVSFIGALGSRKTHAGRCERLKASGFTEAEIARVQGPVGLPIGARTPAEIAVSILAAIVQTRNRPRA